MSAEVRVAHDALIATLRQLRNPDGGWPYYRGKHSRLEPTSWALLAAAATYDSTPLGHWAGGDGLLVEPATGHVNYTFNALAALAISANGTSPHPLTRAITAALIEVKGVTIDRSPVIEQDTTLQGWSWTPGTFTWVEPTAWSMLALKRWPVAGAAAAHRLDVGEQVLRDRACADGGWNFGNGIVYGTALPAHVPPTAIGVLALQDRAADPLVLAAVRHLERHALSEGSTTALALSALALGAVGRSVEAIVGALIARCARADQSSNAAALGMAACALDMAARGGPSPALNLAAGSGA